MGRDERNGRRVVTPADMGKELKRLSPEQRHERLKRRLEVRGEDVESVDGWTPYGPKKGNGSRT